MTRKIRIIASIIVILLIFVFIFQFNTILKRQLHQKSTKELTGQITSKAYGLDWIKVTSSSVDDSDEKLFPDPKLFDRSLVEENPKSRRNRHDKKYFYESEEDDYHADIRYYSKNLTDSEHVYHLVNLLKVWSRFTSSNEIVSWVNHGALLSWYWNGKLFPWEKDLDFQVTLNDLKWISNRFNQTMVEDRYLVDINPNFIYRFHQPANVIDARFIDTLTGLYIDITALSIEPRYIKQTLLCCKSPHCYSQDQLFPLHRISIAGTHVYRPNNYTAILEKEYGNKSMHEIHFGKYTFDGSKWVTLITERDNMKLLGIPGLIACLVLVVLVFLIKEFRCELGLAFGNYKKVLLGYF